ncbi:MAG: pimeloyl-ACP methyl ester carboxylesterase [Arenicella sp.]|jgi:pimeloyl-ACP methyl ester carboxylesterase
MTSIDLKPPSFITTAKELLTPLELARLVAATPALSQQVRGNREPIMVLPGLGTSDVSTLIMRKYLSWLGYDVRGWDLGRNTGDVGRLLPQVTEQINRHYALSNTKVSLIGWSLGGVLAREIARDHPALIRQIITLGSPVVGGPKYTSFGRLYQARGANLDAIEARIAERERRPISVPITSIYSKRDGIVGWQASIDKFNRQAEHVEVKATHLGLGVSPEVFKVLARKLAQSV